MKHLFTAVTTAALCIALMPNDARGQGSATYFPGYQDWQRKSPSEVGMNPALIDEAVKVAASLESKLPRDLYIAHSISFGREPYDTPIGPMQPRGPASGLIIHKGYVVAEWGEPKRVDMTFSVAKTFLTTVVGLAYQRGLIRNLDDPARNSMPKNAKTQEDGLLFESEHNRKITWDHLLRQTSDWQGTLWGKPDWADRPVGEPATWSNRELHEPGTFFKYNDVRVNVLALAALHVWRKPLPDVLKQEIMDPIGASKDWRWVGYDNSWVKIGGKRMQSVSGGSHWGGGLFIDSYDMARFGYLFLRNGKWQDRQIVSEDWFRKARTPVSFNPNYGFANWYLNNSVNGRKPLPSAPMTAVQFIGNGNNIVYVDWENDIVVVARWTTSMDPIVDKVLASLGGARK